MLRGGFIIACVFGTLLTSSAIADAAPRAKKATQQTPTPKKKATNAKPKGKPAYSAPPPLTAESLGLSSVSLASTQTQSEPPAAAATPAAPTPTTPTPEPVAAPETTSASPTTVDLGGSTDKDKPMVPEAGPRRRFTIGVNPLPIIAGRYGLNMELVIARHHAIVASGFYQTFTPQMLRVIMPKAVDSSRGAEARVGGELGYRFYSGRDGANGVFAGISGVAMPLAYPRVTPDFKTEVVSFYGFGGALDIGAQAITSSGFTIGGGIGVMYLAYATPSSPTPPPGVDVPKLIEPHVLPRVLLSAGWSF